MDGWLGTLAGDALLATLLAAAAAAAARFRRPALAHGLCVLALLALLTPPLLPVPVLPAPPAPPASRPAVGPARLAALAPPAALARAPAERLAPPRDSSAAALALGVWLAGSLALLTLLCVRARRFARLLRAARPPSPALALEAERLAPRLGLRRAPRLALVQARVPPLLWPTRRGLLLVLPQPLLRRLSSGERATLLLHELAHVRRRDPWVRPLEALATVAFWWLPTVWWLRRCLRESEEQCCDLWVVQAQPDGERCYADALLATVDYLSGARLALPPGASGAGPVSQLEQRLTMIMDDETKKSRRQLGLFARIALALGAAMLPLAPTHAQEPEQKPGKPAASSESERLREALERIEALEQRLEQAEPSKRTGADSKSDDAKARREKDALHHAHDALLRHLGVSKQDLDDITESAKDAEEAGREIADTVLRSLRESGLLEHAARAQQHALRAQEHGVKIADDVLRKLAESGALDDVEEHGREITANVLRSLRESGVLDHAAEGRAVLERLLHDEAFDGERWRRWADEVSRATKSAFAEKDANRGRSAEDRSKKEQERGDAGGDPLRARDDRIADLQQQIATLQSQLADLQAELRRLQRRSVR